MRRRAATLIESVLAFTLLALGGLALLNLLPSAWLTSQASEQRLRAGVLATSVVEHFRGGDLRLVSEYQLEPVSETATSFYALVNVTQPDPTNSPQLCKIQVQVRWQGRRDRPQQIQREVLVCRLPR